MAIVIDILLLALGAYFLLGLFFGIYFFFAGARRIDPLIAESKWTVRLLLVPGAVGLWLVLLYKMLSNQPRK